jgi:hypothetical protein
MDFESLRAMLQQLFEEADVNSTGQLTLPEVMQVMLWLQRYIMMMGCFASSSTRV